MPTVSAAPHRCSPVSRDSRGSAQAPFLEEAPITSAQPLCGVMLKAQGRRLTSARTLILDPILIHVELLPQQRDVGQEAFLLRTH